MIININEKAYKRLLDHTEDNESFSDTILRKIKNTPSKHGKIRREQNKIKDRVIYKRGNKCEMCGISPTPYDKELYPWEKRNVLLVHHIIPVVLGGDNRDSNLQVLCRSCHTKVHSKMGDY